MPLKATENLYAVATVGLAKNETLNFDENNPSYKLAMGYQFDRQWYVEAGLQKLASQTIDGIAPITLEQADNGDVSMDISALFVAFLGKAAGPMGELFYRVGILKTDIRSEQTLAGAQQCAVGNTSPVIIDEAQYTYCHFDKSGVAGVIGLGFDFFVGSKTMVRSEIEYISGQNDVKAVTAYLGLRYNF